jgi:ABC-type Zn uptake system ZnuABC Zn-binding protein ZnuA
VRGALAGALLWLAAAPAWGGAPLPIVTTTTDLKALVEAVGGDRVRVVSLAPALHDPHSVEVKPGALADLKAAALLVRIGLDHEPWLAPVLRTVGEARLTPGGAADLDVSRGIALLDTETPRAPAERGVHVHGFGNPHYWLDPENGRRIAKAIQEKLSQLDGANASYYAQRQADFERRLSEAEARWKSMIAPYKGLKVVTYHRSWSNFCDAFGVEVIGYIEPKPGIPPTPQHTLDVINAMKAQNVRIVIVEPYFDLKTPNAIGAATGAKVLVLPPSVGGVKEVTDYFKLFDYDINLLITAVKETGSK